jgi:hypothetical protein
MVTRIRNITFRASVLALLLANGLTATAQDETSDKSVPRIAAEKAAEEIANFVTSNADPLKRRMPHIPAVMRGYARDEIIKRTIKMSTDDKDLSGCSGCAACLQLTRGRATRLFRTAN